MIPFIRFKNTSFAHAQMQFFQNFNWTIHQGENWIITGKTGSGKTSLVQALSGRYFLTEGQLSYPFLEKLQPDINSAYSLKKKYIRVVSFKDDSRSFNPHSFFYAQRFNSFAADGTITVWEYLIEEGYSEYKKEHVDLIKQTGIFPLLDMERIKLSSGQSRKLLITSAILQKPKLLIIDNPYLGLDVESRKEFNQLLDQLVHVEGIQLILSGQYDQLPKCISMEIELDHFKPVYTGKIRNNQQLPEENKLEKRSFSKINTELISTLKTHFKSPQQDKKWNSIFELKNVTVAYYGKKILDQLNWHVKPGEKWALTGKNGSGKSTLLSLIFGDHPQAYSNEIYLFDQKRGMGQSIWDIKKRTGFTSAELHYFFSARLSAEETIITGLFDHVYLKRSPNQKERELIDLLIRFYNLESLKKRPFQKLSTGEQRVVLLIRALIKNPPLILLDEPFQGFDIQGIEKSKFLLDQILSDRHTLIFISHYEREIPKIVDKRFSL